MVRRGQFNFFRFNLPPWTFSGSSGGQGSNLSSHMSSSSSDRGSDSEAPGSSSGGGQGSHSAASSLSSVGGQVSVPAAPRPGSGSGRGSSSGSHGPPNRDPPSQAISVQETPIITPVGLSARTGRVLDEDARLDDLGDDEDVEMTDSPPRRRHRKILLF